MIKKVIDYLLSLNRKKIPVAQVPEIPKSYSPVMSNSPNFQKSQQNSTFNMTECMKATQSMFQEIERLQEENRELDKRLSSAQEENRELDKRLSSALSSLSKRDIGAYQTVNDPHSALGARSKQFESDLYNLSRLIYRSSKFNQQDFSREEDKRCRAEIQYNLSKIILTDQLRSPAIFSPEGQGKEVEKIIMNCLAISSDASLEPSFSSVMESFREQFSILVNNVFLGYVRFNPHSASWR